MQRRTLLGAAALTLAAARLGATGAGAGPAMPGPPQSLPLWPGHPPDGVGPSAAETVDAAGTVRRIATPRLRLYRPARPNGAAMLTIAGGGYINVGLGGESTPAARWLQALGVTVYELVYRLPCDGWSRRAPLQDAQRAMRLIRAGAARQGLDPQRIGVLGFSAGGHLAGITATLPDEPRYTPCDASDSVSARADLALLVYPVISMLPRLGHTSSMRQLLGETADPAEAAALSIDRRVDRRTPPHFLLHASDDPIVKLEHSLDMYAALRAAQVPAELHVFERGGHGFGLGRPGEPKHAWPALAEAWLSMHGFLAPA